MASAAPALPFAEETMLTRSRQLYRIVGPCCKTGRTAWWLLLVDHTKENRFLRAFNGTHQPVPIDQFGTLAASGWGDHIPDDVEQRIRKEYCED